MALRGITADVVGIVRDRVIRGSAAILLMGGTAPGVLFLVAR